MKILFLATSKSPDSYSFDGEVIIVNHGNETEHFDLSELEEGGKFDSDFTVETLELNNSQIIRDAERVNGELLVKLCQCPPVTKITYIVDGKSHTVLPDSPETEQYEIKVEHQGGDWTESDWMASTVYDDETLYIKEK